MLKAIGFFVAFAFATYIAYETLRWVLRPEARRLRQIRKIEKQP